MRGSRRRGRARGKKQPPIEEPKPLLDATPPIEIVPVENMVGAQIHVREDTQETFCSLRVAVAGKSLYYYVPIVPGSPTWAMQQMLDQQQQKQLQQQQQIEKLQQQRLLLRQQRQQEILASLDAQLQARERELEMQRLRKAMPLRTAGY